MPLRSAGRNLPGSNRQLKARKHKNQVVLHKGARKAMSGNHQNVLFQRKTLYKYHIHSKKIPFDVKNTKGKC